MTESNFIMDIHSRDIQWVALAATANLILYERYDLISKIRKNMRHLEKLLEDLIEIDIVTDVRHKGLLAAIELRKNNKDIMTVCKKPIGQFIAEESLKRGMYPKIIGEYHAGNTSFGDRQERS